MNIRFAKESDARALLKIYQQYIDTTVTFEYVLPSEEEFQRRIREFSEMYPYLVCEEDGNIIGYAYAHRAFERAAFQWDAEVSIYLDRDARGKGIGTALYEKILDILQKQNFCICYAKINDDNKASIMMHEKYGFRQIGAKRNCGYKFGKWHSIIFFEKQLNEFSVPPKPIIPISELNYEF